MAPVIEQSVFEQPIAQTKLNQTLLMQAPQKRKVVISAKQNMIEHIALMAASRAQRYNAQLKYKRQQYKKIFKLDKRMRANERSTLIHRKSNFLKCSYTPNPSFFSDLNQLRSKDQRMAQSMSKGADQNLGFPHNSRQSGKFAQQQQQMQQQSQQQYSLSQMQRNSGAGGRNMRRRVQNMHSRGSHPQHMGHKPSRVQ